MGAEGHVTIARVVDGHHLIKDEDPTFKVIESVAVWPVKVEEIDQCTVTPYLSSDEYILLKYENARLINLGHIYAAVYLRERMEEYLSRTIEGIRLDLDPWHGKAPEYIRAQWDRITPGWWWIVSAWDTEGNGHDCPPRKGVKLDHPPVTWEWWT